MRQLDRELSEYLESMGEGLGRSVAGDKGSGCIGMRLYLHEEWASDGSVAP